ncbi:hypothetical protein OTU49_008558, partial [Cherax quadricarinatus]
LQAMAFGISKTKNKKKANKVVEVVDKEASVVKANGQVNSRLDEEWQRRDNDFIREENERCLKEALMLSKLDFEEKKKFYQQMKKEQAEEGKGGKVKKKKDKPLTMSLDQFNNLRPDQYGQEVRASQYEAELEKRDFEIQALRLEVDSLKSELLLVKTRNKKLCEVFCSAEMKSKAELVVELDKMTKVREELTQEVSNLSAQVEQERSKVNQLTLDLKKSHGKKKQNSDASNKE